jgi:hypothetical protein
MIELRPDRLIDDLLKVIYLAGIILYLIDDLGGVGSPTCEYRSIVPVPEVEFQQKIDKSIEENPRNFSAKTPRGRREEKTGIGSQIKEFSPSLPPLCELGVLAVKFFDFEDGHHHSAIHHEPLGILAAVFGPRS